MSKIQKTIIKFAGALLTIAAILVTPMHSVAAWGPERPTYTNESPASYATFNSITNNVAVGDERNFVRIGEAGSTDPYVNEIEVVPGKEYEVYIYYHNDAASNTNETGFGMATSTKVSWKLLIFIVESSVLSASVNVCRSVSSTPSALTTAGVPVSAPGIFTLLSSIAAARIATALRFILLIGLLIFLSLPFIYFSLALCRCC